MGIIAVYDTAGIQSYIFSSNKLAENVGASKLVADVFRTLLPEVIGSVTGQAAPEIRRDGGLDPSLQAEIIYQGGGNAFVAFADGEVFQAVTKAFLIRVGEFAPGVGVAVAAIETDYGDTYKSDFKTLGRRLAATKGGFNTPVFARNQPITKQSNRTGLPVSAYRDGEYLSCEQVKKRKHYAAYKKESGSKIDDFSDLAFDKGSDSLIAIIHADGNNMGSRIQSYMERFETYDEAVPKIRELSRKIDECYKKARERTIEAFRKEYAGYLDKRTKKGLPVPMKHNKPFTESPFLELIGDGDDTTLVIGGRFALDFTARLLREIENTPVEERPFSESAPTACAGVVLFHDHYPFSRGYQLAEELCGSAKKPSRKSDGSYIDFHLHQSGNVSGLSELRKRQYTVDGKTLLQRPWRVTDGTDSDIPDFKWFETNAEALLDTKDFPRNKTKALRNAIGEGDTAANIAISQIRGKKLPALPPLPASEDRSRYAAYFDILEFFGVYENLLNKEGAGNA